MRAPFAACLFALLLHAGGCASSPPMVARLPTGGIDVPVEMWSDVPTVQVTVNGCGPYRFVVDTGATPAVGFSSALAKELGLPTEAGATVLRAGNNEMVRLQQTRVRSLTFGGAVFENVPAVVGDVNVPGFAGFLGMRLFAGAVLTVQFPKQRMLLRPGRLDPSDPQTFTARFIGYRPTVPVTPPVTGRPRTINALLDTGSNGGIGLPRTLRDELVIDPEFRATERATTLGGEMSMDVVLLAAPLGLHRYKLDSPLIGLHDGLPTVGTRTLRAFDVTVDLASSRVGLRLTGMADPPDSAEGSAPRDAVWHGVSPGAPSH